MTLPSKELVSEVLKHSENITIECVMQNPVKQNEFIVHYVIDGVVGVKEIVINIYEFAHNCKEWARIRGYVIIQDTRGYTKAYRFPNGERKIWEDEDMDLSIDRIIQSCEWIMEHTK